MARAAHTIEMRRYCLARVPPTTDREVLHDQSGMYHRDLEVLHGLVLHTIDRRRYCVARAAHTIENELLHGQSITNHRHVEVLHGQSANYPR